LLALKYNFNAELVAETAEVFAGAWREFPAEPFCSDALRGLDELEFSGRTRHIAEATILKPR